MTASSWPTQQRGLKVPLVPPFPVSLSSVAARPHPTFISTSTTPYLVPPPAASALVLY